MKKKFFANRNFNFKIRKSKNHQIYESAIASSPAIYGNWLELFDFTRI